MDKKRILLLVPPADKQYIRDYYCSFSSKSGYYWPPQDLVVLSGSLSNRFELDVIDAIALKLSLQDCLKAVSSCNADMIITVTGTATLSDDLNFLELVKKNDPQVKIILSSSIFLTLGIRFLLEYHFIDGVILDFTNDDVANYILGEYDAITSMYFRKGDEIINRCSEPAKSFSIAIPRHDLFIDKRYRIQLFRKESFAITITSIGCPYKCSFCCAGNVKYRTRAIDNIIEELLYVKNSLGIRSIFFANPILFVNKDYAVELFNSIIKNKLSGIEWIANVRIDILDEELISLMRQAGCRALLFGIESGDQDILDKYGKGITLSNSKTIFNLCKRHNISTLAYFMLGFPEDNQTSINNTLRFVLEAACDYISVGFVVPDIGTRLRGRVIEENCCSADLLNSWDSSAVPYIKNISFSQEELVRIRRRIYRSFYLRPEWIMRHLPELNLRDLISGGARILSN